MAHTEGNTSHIRKIAIVGDNRISTSIIRALTSNPTLSIHHIIPPQLTSPTFQPPNLTLHPCPLTTSTLTPLLSSLSPDLLINTPSPGSHTTQPLLISACLAAHIPRFIPAEFSHDTLNPRLQARLPPLREKARTVNQLRSLEEENRISWVGIATGYTPLDHGLLSGNLGFDLQWRSATMHGSGRERFAASSATWVGKVVQRVVERWEEVQGRYLYVAGMMTSADEVLQCLEEVSEGQGWEAGRGEVEECVREAERRIERGFPDAGMFLMERSVLYDEGLGAARPFIEEDGKAVLGLGEGESVKEVVEGVWHEFRHHGGKADCGCD